MICICCLVNKLCPTFLTPWSAACQVLRSSTITQKLLKLISTEAVMLSNHFIPCCSLRLCLQVLPASGSFPMSLCFTSGGQIIGASASISVLPMNIQCWFSGLTGLISLKSNGLLRAFSKTTIPKHQFLGAQPTLWCNSHIHIWLLGKS